MDSNAKLFISCVHTNNLPHAKKMIADGLVDINSYSGDETFLIAAADKGLHHFVKWAIEMGADLNWALTDHIPAVHRAARNGHYECVKALVEANAYIGSVNGLSSAALFALKFGHKEIFDYLDGIRPDETFKGIHGLGVVNTLGTLLEMDKEMMSWLEDQNAETVLHMLSTGKRRKGLLPVFKSKRQLQKRIAKRLYELPERMKSYFFKAAAEPGGVMGREPYLLEHLTNVGLCLVFAVFLFTWYFIIR